MAKSPPEIAPGIIVDRQKGFGVPVVKGTAMPVAEILDRLARGETYETLEREGGLTRDGVLAAISYAAEIAEEEPPARKGPPYEVSPGVTLDPEVRFGRAVLKGRRVDAATVLRFLALGESFESVATELSITPEQIRDALRYGHMLVAREKVSAG